MLYPFQIHFWKHLLTSLLLIGFSGLGNAQSAIKDPLIDSLIVRVPLMMRSHEDSARRMIDELAKRSKQLQHKHGIIQSLFFKVWLSYRHNSADIAISSIDSVLNHVKGVEADTALVKFYILKGQCFVKKTQFSKALENFNLALDIAEKRNDKANKTGTLISIGWAYMEDGKMVEAIHFFNEVLLLQPSENYENRAVLLCNIASCYNTLGDYKQAETYAQQGIKAARSKRNNSDLANGLNILARSYYQQGKAEKAISILKEAAVAREKVSDPAMLASDYLELADLYRKTGEPAQAITWAKKAEALSVKQGNGLKMAAAFESLAAAYEAMGDSKNTSLYLKKLLLHKDSLADEHYNQAFAQMQVKFETQKKTAENLQLKKENLETKLRNSNQQRWLLALVAGILFLIASGIYISKLMKSRYKTRLALEQLNEQKKRAIAVMEAEEKERRRIAADLHDGVGQTLAAASMQLNKAKGGQVHFDKVDELIFQASKEVRSLSHQVTPELLLHYGLVKAIEQAICKLNEANDKVVFTLFAHVEEAFDDEIVSLTLYRCFQELCTNILKHAHATKVVIQLTLDSEEVQLMVEDNGKGFQVGEVQYGLGIRNIESRIAPFDGELQIDSTSGKGTTTIIRIEKAALVSASLKTV
jgi:signal transduction histidine kinase